MNTTFLFIKKDLCIGGIETFIIRFVRWLISHNYRVIYIMPKNSEIAKGFQNTIFSSSVEVLEVDFDDFFWIKKCNINFDRGEKVLAYAFDLWYFVFLEEIKNKYKGIEINTFYWIPHFKDIFIDDYFSCPVNKILRKYLASLFQRIDANNNIVYVNKSHCEAFEKHYSYKAIPNVFKFYKKGKYAPPFDYNLIREKAKREKFVIITVSRLSFPHKAYVLGLIDAFVRLKPQYPHLELWIIGYGPNEEILHEKLSSINVEIQASIRFIGAVEYDELKVYFHKAHLNIGVASALTDGAITGLVSIPVRHYCYNCEGYGYIFDNINKGTSSEPGKPIEEFIEEVVNMSVNDYVNLSKKCYDSCAIPDIDSYYLSMLKNTNINRFKIARKIDILFFKLSFLFLRFFRRILKNDN